MHRVFTLVHIILAGTVDASTSAPPDGGSSAQKNVGAATAYTINNHGMIDALIFTVAAESLVMNHLDDVSTSTILILCDCEITLLDS